jgi:hypothetical protein
MIYLKAFDYFFLMTATTCKASAKSSLPSRREEKVGSSGHRTSTESRESSSMEVDSSPASSPSGAAQVMETLRNRGALV